MRLVAIVLTMVTVAPLEAAEDTPANFLALLSPGQRIQLTSTGHSAGHLITLTDKEIAPSANTPYVTSYTVAKVAADYVLIDRNSIQWKDGKSQVIQRVKVAIPIHKIAEINWAADYSPPK